MTPAERALFDELANLKAGLDDITTKRKAYNQATWQARRARQELDEAKAHVTAMRTKSAIRSDLIKVRAIQNRGAA